MPYGLPDRPAVPGVSAHMVGHVRAVPVLVLVLVAAASPAAAGRAPVGPRLHRYLSRVDNDRSVRQEVLSWHRTMRNGCVAYASTALRRVGVAVPERGLKEGEGVSRITRAFSSFLEQDLGWRRVARIRDLEVGDLVFTSDAPCCPGYPAHVFVFQGWQSRGRGVALATDNQGRRRPRRLAGGNGVDRFAYALRGP
jgi:hypothetical protein